MTNSDFLRTKKIGGRTYQLVYSGVFSKRQNALDEAKLQRRHGQAKVVKHRTKKLWAVYYR